MGEPSSVPQLVPDHPLAVLGPLPQSPRGALVDLDLTAEVAGGVDLQVLVAGTVARPAGAVARHLRGICELRRRSGHSYDRSHKKSRCPELCPPTQRLDLQHQRHLLRSVRQPLARPHGASLR
jgi:hypothetical protein